MKNFWKNLHRPILAAAPLADVTDAAFRRLIAKYSNCPTSDVGQLNDFVMWTEFVSADGLMRATPEGKEKLMADLKYSEEERPIIAQLFSSKPEYMEKATRLCAELGFDGVDINMGCPDRSIEKQGCGSAMIKTPDVAQEIIRAAKRGAPALPVSVKTRLGYNEDQLEDWLPTLLSESPAAVTLHCRTRKELSKVPARWERIKRAVEIRDEIGSEALILGNGDVLSMDDAKEKVQETGADGAMIGRALFGNPWFFHPTRRLPIRMTALPTHGVDRETLIAEDVGELGVEYITVKERLEVMLEHTRLFSELLPHKHFAVMKKHYKAYVNGFPRAKELRTELMETSSVDEVEEIVHRFCATLTSSS